MHTPSLNYVLYPSLSSRFAEIREIRNSGTNRVFLRSMDPHVAVSLFLTSISWSSPSLNVAISFLTVSFRKRFVELMQCSVAPESMTVSPGSSVFFLEVFGGSGSETRRTLSSLVSASQ